MTYEPVATLPGDSAQLAALHKILHQGGTPALLGQVRSAPLSTYQKASAAFLRMLSIPCSWVRQSC